MCRATAPVMQEGVAATSTPSASLRQRTARDALDLRWETKSHEPGERVAGHGLARTEPTVGASALDQAARGRRAHSPQTWAVCASTSIWAIVLASFRETIRTTPIILKGHYLSRIAQGDHTLGIEWLWGRCQVASEGVFTARPRAPPAPASSFADRNRRSGRGRQARSPTCAGTALWRGYC